MTRIRIWWPLVRALATAHRLPRAERRLTLRVAWLLALGDDGSRLRPTADDLAAASRRLIE